MILYYIVGGLFILATLMTIWYRLGWSEYNRKQQEVAQMRLGCVVILFFILGCMGLGQYSLIYVLQQVN